MSGQAVNLMTPWTFEELTDVWEKIGVDIQPYLIAISDRPHGLNFDALARRFSVHERPKLLQGHLSEVNRIHKAFPQRPRLFHYDRKRRVFTMDLDIAAFISKQDRNWLPLKMKSESKKVWVKDFTVSPNPNEI